MSVRRQCPECGDGVGVARRVETVPGRPVVRVLLACQSCGHEWTVERESQPLQQTINNQRSA